MRNCLPYSFSLFKTKLKIGIRRNPKPSEIFIPRKALWASSGTEYVSFAGIWYTGNYDFQESSFTNFYSSVFPTEYIVEIY